MQIVLTVFVTLFISLNLLLVRLFDNLYRHELLVKEGAFSFDPKIVTGISEKKPELSIDKSKVNAPDPVLN